MNSSSSEFVLKVGKKGEIYTSSSLRRALAIKPGSRLVARVVGEGKLLVEVVPTIEDLLKRAKKVRLSAEEVERLSVEFQEEVGVL